MDNKKIKMEQTKPCNISVSTWKLLKEINILNGDSIKESIDKAVNIYVKTLKV